MSYDNGYPMETVKWEHSLIGPSTIYVSVSEKAQVETDCNTLNSITCCKTRHVTEGDKLLDKTCH